MTSSEERVFPIGTKVIAKDIDADHAKEHQSGVVKSVPYMGSASRQVEGQDVLWADATYPQWTPCYRLREY